MPRPRRICVEPRCRRRVYRGRCREHEGARARIRNQQPAARAHRSTAYYRMRAHVLACAGHRCHWCGRRATEVDLVQPLALGGPATLRRVRCAGVPMDPFCPGRRTLGGRRLRGDTSPDGRRRASPERRRGSKSFNRAGVRRSGGLRGEVAREGRGTVPPRAPALRGNRLCREVRRRLTTPLFVMRTGRRMRQP